MWSDFFFYIQKKGISEWLIKSINYSTFISLACNGVCKLYVWFIIYRSLATYNFCSTSILVTTWDRCYVSTLAYQVWNLWTVTGTLLLLTGIPVFTISAQFKNQTSSERQVHMTHITMVALQTCIKVFSQQKIHETEWKPKS